MVSAGNRYRNGAGMRQYNDTIPVRELHDYCNGGEPGMNKYDLLVIGGDAAGMSAASQARRIDTTISIAVLEKGEHVSYAACGMPYLIGGDIDGPGRLVAIDREDYEKRRKIEIHTGTEALSVDFEAKIVTVITGGVKESLAYEKLVIATEIGRASWWGRV